MREAHEKLGPDIVKRAERLAPILEQARETVEAGRSDFLRADLSAGEVEDLVNTRSFERMYGMASKAGALGRIMPEPVKATARALGKIGLKALWPISVGLLTKEAHRISKIEDPEARKRELMKLAASEIDPLAGVRYGISQQATAAEEAPPPGTAESRQQAARKALSPEDWEERRMTPDPAQMGWKERLDYDAAQREEEPEPTLYEETFPLISQAVPRGVTGYPEVSMRKSAAVRALEEEKEKAGERK